MSMRIATCLLLVCFAPVIALAQSGDAQSGDARPGDIDPAEVVEHVPGMPERGTTMASVRSRLGAPNRRMGPVGDPPITRWVYDRFTVYFEKDRVIHAVKNRQH